MSIHCSIYNQTRWGDSSNGGLSSRVKTVTLLDASGPFDPTDDAPGVVLVRRNFGGREYVHAESATPAKGCRMFGGAFIYSSDSRFSEAVNNGGYPVALHDREEIA